MGGLPTLICRLVDCYCEAPVNDSISSIPLYLRWILGFSDSVSQVCVSSHCAYAREWTKLVKWEMETSGAPARYQGRYAGCFYISCFILILAVDQKTCPRAHSF